MKKLLTTIIAIAAISTLMAQRPQSPIVFHHYTEYLQYQTAHPDRVNPKGFDPQRAMASYSLKLDSVIGSDNFDRDRWKNEYLYSNTETCNSRQEFHYEWENQVWIPKEMTETLTSDEDGLTRTNSFHWNGEGWTQYLTTTYQYLLDNHQLLDHIEVFRVNDSVEEPSSRTTYEYDSQGHLTRIVNYDAFDTIWVENYKYEYAYNADGLLDTCTYFTIRNGSWRSSERKMYSYNESNQCSSFLSQRKGGWNPNSNAWMNSYRYDYEYEDGALVAELYYVASGWFGGELSLDSKIAYHFDANGNLQAKTASIFNEQDWIVRDVYENTFDPSVEASSILGLQPVWESILAKGFSDALEDDAPLLNQWNTCLISSSYLDTQFMLYYSGFAAVEETETLPFTVFGGEGTLRVDSPEPGDFKVVDLLGRVVATRQHTNHAEFQLHPGVYVVGNGSTMTKAIVR